MFYLEKGVSYIFNFISYERKSPEILIILAVTCIVLYSVARGIANSLSPKKTVKAVATKKKIVETTHYQNNMPTGTSNDYYITFETENKEQFKMSVSRKIYNNISVGDSGILMRKGSRFVAFHCLENSGEQEISE